jgi:hypothetical protein
MLTWILPIRILPHDPAPLKWKALSAPERWRTKRFPDPYRAYHNHKKKLRGRKPLGRLTRLTNASSKKLDNLKLLAPCNGSQPHLDASELLL